MTGQQPRISEIRQLWNCEHAFENRCPKEWASLEQTDDDNVRFCHECQQSVTFCETPEEFVRLGNDGHCVAIPESQTPSKLHSLVMGRPSPQYMQELRKREARVEKWWTRVLASDPEFSADALKAIDNVLQFKNKSLPDLSPEHREHLTRLLDAIKAGPEELYLFLRKHRLGKRAKQQNIFKAMQMHFNLTFKEFIQLANRLDKEHPV